MSNEHKMVRVTTPLKVTREFPYSKLADLCLEVAGGGYDAKQTADAMALRSKVESTGKGTLRKFKFEVVSPASTPTM